MAETKYSTIGGRKFGYYVPDAYDASKPTPVLFMFHGFGGDSSTQSGGSAERKYYGWQDTADKNGFITIFPESTGAIKAWNLAPGGKSPDLGYVEDLIDWADQNFTISQSQIFTTGHSWGAYFSYYVAKNLSEKIAAFGAHSGGSFGGIWFGTPQVPAVTAGSSALNGIILHAKDDGIVPYANSQKLYDDLVANGHNVYQDGIGKDGIIEVDGWGPQNHRYRLEHNQSQWDFFTSVAPYLVENFGSTELVKNSLGGGYIRNPDGSLNDITYQGTQMSDGYFPGWSMVGAETINGTNTVAWTHASGLLSIWETDANWAYSSHAIRGVNTSAGLQWEEAFGQDFNGDQVVGFDPLA